MEKLIVKIEDILYTLKLMCSDPWAYMVYSIKGAVVVDIYKFDVGNIYVVERAKGSDIVSAQKILRESCPNFDEENREKLEAIKEILLLIMKSEIDLEVVEEYLEEVSTSIGLKMVKGI